MNDLVLSQKKVDDIFEILGAINLLFIITCDDEEAIRPFSKMMFRVVKILDEKNSVDRLIDGMKKIGNMKEIVTAAEDFVKKSVKVAALSKEVNEIKNELEELAKKSVLELNNIEDLLK